MSRVSWLVSVSALHLLLHHHPEPALLAQVGGEVVAALDLHWHRLVASHVRPMVAVRRLVVHLALGTRVAGLVHLGCEGDQSVKV